MAIGVSLNELLLALRGELMQSVNPAHSVNSAPAHRQILARTQRQLWYDFAWPHLRVDRDVPMLAGARYYDFPTDLDMDRVEHVSAQYQNRWHDMTRGVGPEQYNSFDSDADVRADPVLRWQPYGLEQFEVWPIPVADSLQTVRLRGIRNLSPLVDDSDLCELDEDLIVLTAAAELLADGKSPRAQLVGARASRLYTRLKQRGEHGDSGRFSMGGVTPGRPDRGRRLGPPLVAVDRGA